MTGEHLELQISDDAMEIVLKDNKRGCGWRLDPRQRLADDTILPAGVVERLPDGCRVTHALPAGKIVYRWTLADDHVRVELESAPDAIASLSLPGSFRPVDGQATMLLSVYQGVLCRPTGEPWSEKLPPGGHWQFSMAMNALLGERGGLLVTQETITDWVCACGENNLGLSFCYTQLKCPVNRWYRREVRLYPVDSSITAVAKRYRRRVQERGEFVSWDEKIARRPIVEKLFGALLAFTGYNHAPEVDYVAGAKKLNEMGFESVLHYPVRFAHNTLNFLMGGDRPIWMSDADIQRVKAVPGALVAPWAWYIEGLDDGSEQMPRIYQRNLDGSTTKGWSIEKQQWHVVCTGEQVAVARQRFAADLQGMDWIHYDVSANGLGHGICYAKNHASHPGQPLTRTDEVKWTQQLLSPEVNGNRIVSSEGFIDRYASRYDLGSTKVWAAGGPGVDFIPVPLTMLVFHDCAIHNWWECNSYNFVPGFHARHDSRFGVVGSGNSQKMAAQDALYGCPPQVFPFGRQYAWVDYEARRTFSFCIQLTDRVVQKALQTALPITQLHRRIGKQELLSFDIVTPDGAVQTTQFADGTRIVANISDKPLVTNYGRMEANSWKEISA